MIVNINCHQMLRDHGWMLTVVRKGYLHSLLGILSSVQCTDTHHENEKTSAIIIYYQPRENDSVYVAMM